MQEPPDQDSGSDGKGGEDYVTFFSSNSLVTRGNRSQTPTDPAIRQRHHPQIATPERQMPLGIQRENTVHEDRRWDLFQLGGVGPFIGPGMNRQNTRLPTLIR